MFYFLVLILELRIVDDQDRKSSDVNKATKFKAKVKHPRPQTYARDNWSIVFNGAVHVCVCACMCGIVFDILTILHSRFCHPTNSIKALKANFND